MNKDAALLIHVASFQLFRGIFLINQVGLQQLFSLLINLLIILLKNDEKCRSVFPKAQYDILKCLVLSTTQRYSGYCQRGGKKPGNIHFEEAGIRILPFFLKKCSNRSID